ncbi:MAG: FAD/NAD(P)-binding protein [Balneolaceae bacterium]|nr:FAD/NAD(P)-binding protein [Balneolaceae bacterium]MDR9410376.1 FAD/NAD(P)-binding protein [Balneolaceae bacterium]
MMHRDSILDWAIIGGGIHGIFLANALIRHRIANRSDLCILDPNDEPLAEWKRVTTNVGMNYLRSPKVHNLDVDPLSLKHYFRCNECTSDEFMFPNDRPSIRLFNEHADSVIQRSGLHDICRKGFAADIHFEKNHAVIHSDDESIRAKQVILAVGRSDSLNWPKWAQAAREEGAGICHVLDGSFCRDEIPENGEIIVVGGGMSAAQIAISLADRDRHVTLLSPHSLRQNNYDSNPGWMGPKYLNRFRKIPCFQKRRRVIDGAKNSGTITQDIKWELIKCQNENRCSVCVDVIKNCAVLTDDLMLLNLKSGENIAANHIVLATGYGNQRPGGQLLEKLISRYQLNCSKCGFPITDSTLQWYDRLYVSGTLAELEVGPASGNIIGARMAAEKILRNKIKNN